MFGTFFCFWVLGFPSTACFKMLACAANCGLVTCIRVNFNTRFTLVRWSFLAILDFKFQQVHLRAKVQQLVYQSLQNLYFFYERICFRWFVSFLWLLVWVFFALNESFSQCSVSVGMPKLKASSSSSLHTFSFLSNVHGSWWRLLLLKTACQNFLWTNLSS